MMRLIISNSFSLNMLPASMVQANIELKRCDPKVVIASLREANMLSVVGHADTAAVFTSVIGREVVFNRTSYNWQDGDTLLVGQYSGPRLPEGTTILPEGAGICWYVINIT